MRRHYTPRLTWKPIVPVRWRSMPQGYGNATLGWRLYLFGIVPLFTVPRKAS